MKRQLAKGGAGPCQYCGKEFLRVLRHEPQCKSAPKPPEVPQTLNPLPV